jgi:hypothetical protein
MADAPAVSIEWESASVTDDLRHSLESAVLRANAATFRAFANRKP